MLRGTSALCTLLLLATPSATRAHPPAQLSVEAEKIAVEEVMAFRKALSEAIAAKDARRLRQMYNDSFVHTHSSGKLDGKEARIAWVLTGSPVIETAPAEDVRIRVPGGWTAVATGISRLSASQDAGVQTMHWTSVYVRGERGFEVAASHETRLQD